MLSVATTPGERRGDLDLVSPSQRYLMDECECQGQQFQLRENP